MKEAYAPDAAAVTSVISGADETVTAEGVAYKVTKNISGARTWYTLVKIGMITATAVAGDITVFGKTYSVSRSADAAEYGVYLFTYGGKAYKMDAATRTVTLADGKAYDISFNAQGSVVLTEKGAVSREIMAVRAGGRILLAYRSEADADHAWRFFDGTGNYAATRETPGFSADGSMLFNDGPAAARSMNYNLDVANAGV
ncbi:hypothetical protein LDC_1262, partial [sediment metagenome]